MWRRKLRTILTALGVLIGTASIIIMVSLGIGINVTFMENLSSYSSLTQITIYNYGGYSPDGTTRVKLDKNALEAIAALAHVDIVTPVMQGQFQVKAGKYQTYSLTGITPEAQQAFGMKLGEGSFFDDSDTIQVVMSLDAARNFYDEKRMRNFRGGEWPSPPEDFKWLDTKLKLILQNYDPNWDGTGTPPEDKEFKGTVVGLLSNTMDQMSYQLFCNIGALEKIYRQNKQIAKNNNIKIGEYNEAWVKVDDFNNVIATQQLIKDMGYECYSSAEYVESSQQSMRSLQMLLGAIGAVAMLVASLMIMNTMLMSIYERTREIGVMKVLGCKLSNIRLLFLMEAGMLGLLGGSFGILLSYAGSVAMNLLLFASGDGGGTGLPMRSVIPPWLALVGMAFAVGVGILAGLYPAQRAMGLSALAAIRNED